MIGRFHTGTKMCYSCRHLFPKQELIKGKFKRIFCPKCILKVENASSKQNYSLQVSCILKKRGCGVNEE